MTKEIAAADKGAFADMTRLAVGMIEERSVYLQGQPQRVAALAVGFGKALALDAADMEALYLAALFHDIGMVYMPGIIIDKPGKLSAEEWDIIRQHPVLSEKVLKKVKRLKEALPLIRHHHEAFKGQGYPDGLQGGSIPAGARLLAIVETYAVLQAARPGRKALSQEQACKLMKQESGRQFDPEMVGTFLEFVQASEGSSDKAPERPGRVTADGLTNAITEIVINYQKGKIDLPVLPQVAHDVEQVIKNPDSSSDDLAQVIEKDGVMSIRLIAIVNSSLYRGAEKIPTVRQALPRLGRDEIRNIVSAVANRNIYASTDETYRSLMDRLWLHALAAGYGARFISEKLGLGDAGGLFLMGLVHDIGKVLLLKALSDILPNVASLNAAELISGIQEVHCKFGGIALIRAGFNRDFVKIATAHDETKFPATASRELLVVSLANRMTRKIGYSLIEDDGVKLAELDVARQLGLGDDALEALCREVSEVMQEAGNTF
ncbi:MAG: HDOD domain-containing protein [Deltaproteobacteria bacterium]|nr:HDOD domain-containing protein [Deltaproteobacteria bacterium]